MSAEDAKEFGLIDQVLDKRAVPVEEATRG